MATTAHSSSGFQYPFPVACGYESPYFSVSSSQFQTFPDDILMYPFTTVARCRPWAGSNLCFAHQGLWKDVCVACDEGNLPLGTCSIDKSKSKR